MIKFALTNCLQNIVRVLGSTLIMIIVWYIQLHTIIFYTISKETIMKTESFRYIILQWLSILPRFSDAFRLLVLLILPKFHMWINCNMQCIFKIACQFMKGYKCYTELKGFCPAILCCRLQLRVSVKGQWYLVVFMIIATQLYRVYYVTSALL